MSCLSKPGPTRRAKCVHKLVRPPQVSHPPACGRGLRCSGCRGWWSVGAPSWVTCTSSGCPPPGSLSSERAASPTIFLKPPPSSILHRRFLQPPTQPPLPTEERRGGGGGGGGGGGTTKCQGSPGANRRHVSFRRPGNAAPAGLGYPPPFPGRAAYQHPGPPRRPPTEAGTLVGAFLSPATAVSRGNRM